MAINLGTLTDAAATGAWFPVGAGAYSVVAKGTFDSGTVSIETSDDGGATTLDCGDDADFTANGMRTLEIGEGMVVRAVIAGHGATADVDVTLRPMKTR